MIPSQTVSLKLLAAAVPVAGGGHREGVAWALGGHRFRAISASGDSAEVTVLVE
jgi:hypothetical protein